MPDFPTILADALHGGTCLSLILSRKRTDVNDPLEKVTVRPVVLRGVQRFQFASRIGGKEIHENLAPPEAVERMGQLFGPVFRDCHLYTTGADYSARIRSNGEIKFKRTPPTKQPTAAAHDRAKHYLIPENVPCPFLAEIGVMTPAGKVRAAKSHKFRQINRFLELVDDVLRFLPPEGELHIVDFGSGKSSLTFALHHLLTQIYGRRVHLVGLDRNAEVIRECARLAERLGCEGLEFHVGDIAGHEAAGKVDLAVSLHACDTATDDALAKAVEWSANVILAVPCCQHELLGKLHSAALRPLEQHGLLKERFAALATDALRAKALEIMGYKTQVVEFIDMEHTPKNILIRALRRPAGRSDRAAHVAAYRDFKESLGLERIYLDEVFGEPFLDTSAVSFR